MILLSFIFAGIIAPTLASIPSTAYVQQQIANQIATAVANKADISALKSKVDTGSSANQTMAGTYTVSGTFNVPTPTLPTATE